MIAQLGATDMQHAIQYAITYPKRAATSLPPIDFAEISKLTFENPDLDRFPNLGLAYKALKKGGTTPAVLNASNEIAVQAFLDEKIRLNEIAEVNEKLVAEHHPTEVDSLEAVLDADAWAREEARSVISQKKASVSSVN